MTDIYTLEKFVKIGSIGDHVTSIIEESDRPKRSAKPEVLSWGKHHQSEPESKSVVPSAWLLESEWRREILLTSPRLAPAPSIKPPSNVGSDLSWAESQNSAEVTISGDSSSAPPLPEKDLTSLQTTEVAVDLESQTPSEPSSTLGRRLNDMRRKFKLSPRMISDAIIGISDGMTVPFALTAGLASLGTTRIVIYAGLAELVAGAISMGLGGFIGAKSEAYAIILPVDMKCS